jgi:hypothetical protein
MIPARLAKGLAMPPKVKDSTAVIRVMSRAIIRISIPLFLKKSFKTTFS